MTSSNGTPGSARTVILTDPDRLPGTAAEKQALADAKLKACVNGVLNGMGNVMAWGVATFGGLWYAMARARRSNGK